MFQIFNFIFNLIYYYFLRWDLAVFPRLASKSLVQGVLHLSSCWDHRCILVSLANKYFLNE